MNPLAERIARLIAAQGPLSIAQFTTMALHDPSTGYYATRDPLGARGDFTTAPEISQAFGELLGLWCVQVWRDQGLPEKIRLVELGPGRGTLMQDVLRAAKLAPDFLKAADVVLVEASPALREIQRARLAKAHAKIQWSDRFEDSLTDRPLFLLANEFFDALPIRQYVKTARGWCERVVTVEDGKLAFALAPSPSAIEIMAERDPVEDGAVYEVSPAALALSEEIARVIARHGGAALVVDYGYAGGALGETLQAVRHHRFAGILDEPGETDLSAHVDFLGLAAAATQGGATVFGPVAQGALLERLGIGPRGEQLQRANPSAAPAVAGAIHRLVDPGKMGTLFKALAILPPNAPPPPGF